MSKSKNTSWLETLIVGVGDKKAAQEFLTSLFTEEELETLGMRLEIVKLLKQGLAQRKIAEKLQVGIATVTRGAKEVNKGHFSFVK